MDILETERMQAWQDKETFTIYFSPGPELPCLVLRTAELQPGHLGIKNTSS